MFEAVCTLGLEGIVSKRAKSIDRSGPSWRAVFQRHLAQD
jgi:hypothetical protein